MKLNPRGRDWSLLVNWDDLGKLYAGIIVAWTVILGTGIIWLIANRRLPSIKIRNIALAIAAVCFLHVYLIKIFLAYTTNGHFPCSAEFWIMSIYLPFGIALFQASTAQLKSISEEQKSLLYREPNLKQPHGKFPKKCTGNIRSFWRNSTTLKKTYAYIGLGMLVQLIITSVLFATSPTLQGDWSSYGQIKFSAGQARCRRSLEWIPSAFWQLFWSWIYGPFMLYKIRNICDTHFWRLQVIITVLSGLPGVPLWLATLYSPPATVKPLNKWWVPPMWLAPGIIVMQAVTIFLPMYEVYRDRKQLKQTVGILQTWEESRRKDDIQSMSYNSSLNSYEKRPLSGCDQTSRKSEMYTMTALEKALAVNPQPLLQFAATQDFTAENVVFLMQVRLWRTEWDNAEAKAGNGELDPTTRSRLFDMALEIYLSSIHEDTADFPVNIEGYIRSSLHKVFKSALPSSKRWSTNSDNSNSSTVFDALSLQRKIVYKDSLMQEGEAERASNWDSGSTLGDTQPISSDPTKLDSQPCVESVTSREKVTNEDAYNGHDITRGVFDEAEASVKYLVLTNTWQKLVRAHDHAHVF